MVQGIHGFLILCSYTDGNIIISKHTAAVKELVLL
jgi:hypothetical protein